MHSQGIYRWVSARFDDLLLCHYLEQYYLIVNWTIRNKRQWNFSWVYTFLKENVHQMTPAKLSLYPPLQRSWKGGILVSPCPSVRLSICPSVRLSFCPSVDRIVSALYLQQYSSDPFHICTSYQATSERVSRVMPVSTLKNLTQWYG